MRVDFYVADQNPHRDRSLGISQYTTGLISNLSRRDDIDVYCITSRSAIHPTDPGVITREVPLRTDWLAGRLLTDHLHPGFPGPETDICHYPKGFAPLVLRPGSPTVGTVCDTILDYQARQFPDSRSRAAFAYWRQALSSSIRRFDLILTISEFSCRSILEYCSRERIDCPPIAVTYIGARWENAPRLTVSKRDVVIHLSSRQPHKRTDTLLDFWEILQTAGVDLPLLQIIGNLSAAQESMLNRLRHVEWLPPQSEDGLKAAIETAGAIIIPSEIEGFGLPALEAYYLGTPALYVRGTAIEEILGSGTPGGFDLSSVESFRAAIDEVLGLDSVAIDRKADELRRRFSWDSCADRTITAYMSLL